VALTGFAVGNLTFRPQDVSLPAWTLRLLDILPLDGSSPWRFAPWTIRHLDDSPHTCGRFAPWTFRPLDDRFAQNLYGHGHFTL